MLTAGMRLRMSLVTLAAVVAFAFWVGFAHSAANASAATSGPIAWGPAKALDRAGPYAITNSIFGMSCSTAPLCVGITELGDIVTSADPSSSASGSWSLLPTSLLSGQATGYSLNAVTCAPEGSFCVAQGAEMDPPYDNVSLASTDPTAAKSAWKRAEVPGEGPLLALQCPAAGTCFAVNYDGDFLTYSRGVWKLLEASDAPYSLTTNTNLVGLSCPTTSLCVALGSDGRVYTTTTPKTPTAISFAVAATGLTEGDAISCPTANYCVTSDYAGDMSVSTDPQDGAAAVWTKYTPGFTPAFDPNYAPYLLDCTADAAEATGRSFCLTSAGDQGEPYTSTGGGQTTFTAGTIPAPLASGASGGYGLGVTSIGCADSMLCVLGAGADVTSSTDPTAAASAVWSRGLLVAPGLNPISFGPQSCPTAKLCVGTDGVGRLFTGTPGFKQGILFLGDYASPASCPSAKLCVASLTTPDGDIAVASSTDPGAGVKTWKLSGTIGSFGGLDLSCTSATFCYGFDDSDIITSSHPAGAARKWKQTDIDGTDQLFDLVCASDKACVGTDGAQLVTSTDPGGGKAHWKVTKLSKDLEDLNSFACPSAKLCVAADGQYVAYSTDPGVASSWKRSGKLSKAFVSQITCASDHLCVGVGYAPGRIFVSTDPAHASWKVYDLPDASLFPVSPSCGDGTCTLTLSTGQALESSDPGGGESTWKRVTIPSDGGAAQVLCYNAGICVAADENGDVSEGPVRR